jgi:hypothetical protein
VANRGLWVPSRVAYAHTNPVFQEGHFRFRTVNVDTATEEAAFDASDPAEDTDVTLEEDGNGDSNIRLRWSMNETAGGDENNMNVSLQYRYNGGTWTTIGTATSYVKLLAVSGYANRATIATSRLTADYTFWSTGGQAMDTTAASGAVTWSGGADSTEWEWAMTVIDADMGASDTLEFQLLTDKTAISGTRLTPQITWNAPAADDSGILAILAHLMTN